MPRICPPPRPFSRPRLASLFMGLLASFMFPATAAMHSDSAATVAVQPSRYSREASPESGVQFFTNMAEVQEGLSPLVWTSASWIQPAGPGKRWQHASIGVTAPSGRAVDSYLLVVGGFTPNDSSSVFNVSNIIPLGDVWAYTVRDGAWVELIPEESVPAELNRGSAALGVAFFADGRTELHLHGGQVLQGLDYFPITYNDDWVVSLGPRTGFDAQNASANKLIWRHVPVTTTAPRPPHRTMAASDVYAHRFVILVGGFLNPACEHLTVVRCPASPYSNNKPLDDVWVKDMLAQPQPVWYKVPRPANATWPPARGSAVLVVAGSRAILHGGRSSVNDSEAYNASFVDDGYVWTLNLESLDNVGADAGPAVANLTWSNAVASYASIPDVPTAQLPDIYNVYGAVGVALNDDSVLIAGGRQVAFLINSSPLILNISNAQWSLGEGSLVQNLATTRLNMGMSRVGEIALVTGGYSFISIFDTVHAYIIDSEMWTEVQQYTTPAVRVLPHMIPSESSVWFTGGYDGRQALPDQWRLDLNTMTWELVALVGSAGARMAGVSVTIDNLIYAFFGSGSTGLRTDAYVYDVDSGFWTPLNITGPDMPTPRYLLQGAAAPGHGIANNPPEIYAYGGMTISASIQSFGVEARFLDDMHAFDTASKTWRPLPACDSSQGAACPGARAMARLLSMKVCGVPVLVFYGGVGTSNTTAGTKPFQLGDTGLQSPLGDAWLFDVRAERWWQVEPTDAAFTPGPRVGHVSVALSDTTLLIDGGSPFPSSPGDLGGVTLAVLASTFLGQLTWEDACPGDAAARAAATVAGTAPPPPLTGAPSDVATRPPTVHWIELGASQAAGRTEHAGVVINNTLLVAGGKLPTASVALAPSFLKLACPAGYYGMFGTGGASCKLCPIGTYSEHAGQLACSSCPDRLQTTKPGATGAVNCTRCVPNHCHGYGTCIINPITYGVTCACKTGYGGPRCDQNIALRAALGVLGTLMVVTGAVLMRHRLRRRLAKITTYAELTEQLLDEKRGELEELERAMQVHPDEVELIRRIDGASPGAFGEVWQGRFSDMTVAVKRLQQTVRNMDERAMDDFLAEIKFMRTLRHRNIVYFYGCGVENGEPFLVLEFLGRGALRSILVDEATPLPWGLRLQFARHTAEGMAFLHNLVPARLHRDLKTPNLLVSASWVVKVSDFGTSRLIQHLRAEPTPVRSSHRGTNETALDDATLTRGVGTLLWTAPEVHQGSVYALPADVYSFGIVMWECATRQLPFNHLATTWAIRSAVEDGERPPLLDDAPPGYNGVMERCWSADPDARPTFSEVVQALESIATPEGQEFVREQAK